MLQSNDNISLPSSRDRRPRTRVHCPVSGCRCACSCSHAGTSILSSYHASIKDTPDQPSHLFVLLFLSGLQSLRPLRHLPERAGSRLSNLSTRRHGTYLGSCETARTIRHRRIRSSIENARYHSHFRLTALFHHTWLGYRQRCRYLLMHAALSCWCGLRI